MSVSKEEFDRIHEAGKKLKGILKRDGVRGLDGLEDYLVRAVEEARLTMRASDGAYCDCPDKHDPKKVIAGYCVHCEKPRR